MSVVYFVQAGAGGSIKIGVAGNITSRLASLQTGCPEPLVVLATVPGSHREEQLLHKRLRKHRSRGEWFRPSPEVLEAVELARQGIVQTDAVDEPRGAYLSHLTNLVELIRCTTRCQRWSKCRLADEAGLHRNTLLGCDREDWNPTLSTLLTLERFLHEMDVREDAAKSNAPTLLGASGTAIPMSSRTYSALA